MSRSIHSKAFRRVRKRWRTPEQGAEASRTLWGHTEKIRRRHRQRWARAVSKAGRQHDRAILVEQVELLTEIE